MPPSAGLMIEKTHDSVYSEVTQQVKNEIELLEASSKWGVTPTTLKKILEGRPISRYIEVKIRSALHLDAPSTKSSTVERFLEVYHRYQDAGTLRAAGRATGLSYERVRQLLVKGANLGLFEYRPSQSPLITKEKVLSDYQKYLKLAAVAKANSISRAHLHWLISFYQITGKSLAAIRIRGRQHQCIDAYISIAQEIGRYPTTTDLQWLKSGTYLQIKIKRLWGSFQAFREALGIPPPMRRLPK